MAATPAPATLNWRSLAQSTNRTSRRMGRNVTKLVRRTVSFHVCYFVLDREAKAIKMTPLETLFSYFPPGKSLVSVSSLLEGLFELIRRPSSMALESHVASGTTEIQGRQVFRARHEGPRTSPRTKLTRTLIVCLLRTHLFLSPLHDPPGFKSLGSFEWCETILTCFTGFGRESQLDREN